VVVFAIMVGSIGGCGGDDDSSTTESTEADSSTAPTEADSSPAEPTEADLTQAIEDYWDLLAGEKYSEAYAVLTDACHEQVSEADFTEGLDAAFAQSRADSGFDPAAQVVQVSIDPESTGDEHTKAVQWALAPASDRNAEETLSITGGDQDVWVFDGGWHADLPACGGGLVAKQIVDEQ
jgi:hypothetical protein